MEELWMKGAGSIHTELSPRLSQVSRREAVKEESPRRLIIGTDGVAPAICNEQLSQTTSWMRLSG